MCIEPIRICKTRDEGKAGFSLALKKMKILLIAREGYIYYVGDGSEDRMPQKLTIRFIQPQPYVAY
jgi:hypothetical protein